MVLIQLLLPTSGAASADGLAPLAPTGRELASQCGTCDSCRHLAVRSEAVAVGAA